jgi:hypothetical protein
MKDALKVVWTRAAFQEEVAGLNAYGVWPRGVSPVAEFPNEVWPAGTEVDPTILTDDEWQVLWWIVMVPRWPERQEWRSMTQRTLNALINSGAIVAWCGFEGAFEGPPKAYAQGIWAADSLETGFLCHADLSGEVATLTSDELNLLSCIVGAGLAETKS